MPEFFRANLGTILTGLVVACAVAAVIIKLIRDRRKGKCAACGCGCCRDEDAG